MSLPRLIALLEAAVNGDRLPSDVRAWLTAGICATLRGDQLHDALGLTGPGVRSPSTLLARISRDAFLRAAAAEIAADSAATTWQRAQRLAAQARRLVPVWQRRPNDPPADGWPSWRKALHSAWRAAPLPTTERGFYDALKRTPTF